MMVLVAVDPSRKTSSARSTVDDIQYLSNNCPLRETIISMRNGENDIHDFEAGPSTQPCNMQNGKDETGRRISSTHGSSRNAFGSLRDISDFELLEQLGRGFFGTVWRVKEISPQSEDEGVLVMKIPILHKNSCRLSAKKMVQKEDYMLRLLVHPNILRSRGICVQRTGLQWQLNLLVDFCDGGSLQQLILNAQRQFPWLQRCLIALEICRAMHFVHSRGFMHRDLTSMNILLKSQPSLPYPKALVADFGLSSKIPKGQKLEQVGTQNWMAPEMLKEDFYNEKADIFSFGVIMCQMIARIDADHDAGLYRTPAFGLDYVRFTARCPSETPLTLLKLAFTCCLGDPNSRPSFRALTDQLTELTQQNIEAWSIFPREGMSPGEIRLGRSRSDAAIRGSETKSVSIVKESPRKCGNRTKPPMKKHATILEKIATSENYGADNAMDGKREENATAQFKILAESVASEDPGYQESERNPFTAHVRYRSIRKIKPRDLIKLGRRAANSDCSATWQDNSNNASVRTQQNRLMGYRAKGIEKSTRKSSTASGLISNPSYKSMENNTPREIFRSLSLPSSFMFDDQSDLSDGNDSAFRDSPNRHPYSLLKKTSVTLGLGEQRDLQGHITLSFREFDEKFTSWRSASKERKSDLQTSDVANNESLYESFFSEPRYADRLHNSMSPSFADNLRILPSDCLTDSSTPTESWNSSSPYTTPLDSARNSPISFSKSSRNRLISMSPPITAIESASELGNASLTSKTRQNCKAICDSPNSNSRAGSQRSRRHLYDDEEIDRNATQNCQLL
ncbi:protein tyrosine kinase domain-containing protein [Ditylenchus destructor]|nr:protein tyrosine kinase domain-containing protein [Ditylenchus destructor]